MTSTNPHASASGGLPALADRLLAVVFVVGLAVAATGTLVPFMTSQVDHAAAQQEETDPPLDGSWLSLANGDRINAVEKVGDVVWTATDAGGLVKWDLETATYEQYLAPQDGLLSSTVNDIAVGNNDTLWLATDGGVMRLHPDGWDLEHYTPETHPTMPAKRATAIDVTPEGLVWVGFSQEYDPQTVNPITELPGAFSVGGVGRLDPATGEFDQVTRAKMTGGFGQDPTYETIPSDNIVSILVGENGMVWIGTQPYYDWDNSFCPPGEQCGSDTGAWVLAGGGLARWNDGVWEHWAPTQDRTCYPNHISDMAEDSLDRIWVATLGRGVHMFEPTQGVGACGAGHVNFRKPRGGYLAVDGLKGNHIYSIDVDEQDRIWMAQGERGDIGYGIAVLDHNNTFAQDQWAAENLDDLWRHFDVDNAPAEETLIVTSIWAQDPNNRLIGTQNIRNGDGFGMRRLKELGPVWEPYRTADNGLPSNHITHVTTHPDTGDLWVGTERHGVAQYDGENWHNHRSFQSGELATTLIQPVTPGYGRIPVDFEDLQTCRDTIFVSGPPVYVRVGEDPVLYEVRRCVTTTQGRFLDIAPDLTRSADEGTPIYLVDRGPPSDYVSQIDFDQDGKVWVGGRETIFLTGRSGGHCPTFPECWLDGGLGVFDGDMWQVYNITNSDIPDQEVSAVDVDSLNRVWVGTGNPHKSFADGLAIYDQSTDSWTLHEDKVSSGFQAWITAVGDFDEDPETQHMWVALHAATACAARSPFGGGECSSITRRGGGVGRWDGVKWEFWAKTTGANLRLFGDQYEKKEGGEAYSIKVDRSRQRVWVGGWNGEPGSFHWDRGEGFHAALNWCAAASSEAGTATPGPSPTVTPTATDDFQRKPTATMTPDPGATDCLPSGWSHKIWPEEGWVTSIELDEENRLWSGVSRSGTGIVPPRAGVKLFAEENWYSVHPDNSDIVSHDIMALGADEEGMWVGTRINGISRYLYERLPTPTPSSTRTPTDAPSATPSDTMEPTSTPPDFTPGTPTSTRTVTASDTPSVPSTGGPCVPGEPCYLMHAPIVMQSKPLRTATPTVPTETPRPGSTTAIPASATPTRTPSVTPTRPPGTTAAPPASATNTATDAVTQVPSETFTPSVTPTRTTTPKPTQPPIKQWTIYDDSLGKLDNVDYQAVYGLSKDQVYIIGGNGRIYIFDGRQFYSQELHPLANGKTLRNIEFVDESQGWLVGDGGVVMSTRNGGANWRIVNPDNMTDDWGAVAMFKNAGLVTGWILGRDNGHRVFLEGATYDASSVNRNTRHDYSDAVMLSPTRAYAIRDDGSGARMYEWDGTGWGPGMSTGALYDMHVPTEDYGIAVGDRGNAWEFDGGEWNRMTTPPQTSGRDLYGVHIVNRNLIWAGGERTVMYVWDGLSWSQPQLIPGRNRDINSVWIDPTGAEGWAVGDGGLILRYK